MHLFMFVPFLYNNGCDTSSLSLQYSLQLPALLPKKRLVEAVVSDVLNWTPLCSIMFLIALGIQNQCLSDTIPEHYRLDKVPLFCNESH